MTLHLGILQTDSVLEDLQPRFGDYPSMFEQLFRAEEPTITVTTYDVRRALPKTSVCDAYLITGCKLSVYDDLPWIRDLADFVGRAIVIKKNSWYLFWPSTHCPFFGGHVAPAR